MLRDPAEVERIWSAELDFAHGYCPGGLFGLTCHPEFIGRGARLLMLERLIGRMKGLEGVAFSTMADMPRPGKQPIRWTTGLPPIRALPVSRRSRAGRIGADISGA
ncbi:MAG: hypothetical protein R3D33_06460 [Hyphomicrobiaceae bacterium]